MMNRFSLLRLIYFILLFLATMNCEDIDEKVIIRRKRQLIFTNPSLFQLTLGISVPLPLMSKYRVITSNYAYQANMNCPTNLTQVPLFYLLGPAVTMQRRRRQLEEWPATVNYPPADVEDFDWRDFTSQDMYSTIEDTIDSYGYYGKACLLRSICELAAEPLHAHGHDDVIHELIHFVLTPSTHNSNEGTSATKQSSKNTNPSADSDPYSEAEEFGLNGEDCRNIYSDCEMSFLNIFTKVIDVGHG